MRANRIRWILEEPEDHLPDPQKDPRGISDLPRLVSDLAQAAGAGPDLDEDGHAGLMQAVADLRAYLREHEDALMGHPLPSARETQSYNFSTLDRWLGYFVGHFFDNYPKRGEVLQLLVNIRKDGVGHNIQHWQRLIRDLERLTRDVRSFIQDRSARKPTGTLVGKRKRGRPSDTKPKNDAKVFKGWTEWRDNLENPLRIAAFAKSLERPEGEVRKALERHRKREFRKGVK